MREVGLTNAERTVYLDVLRIIACFFVIVNHTNSVIFLYREPSPLWFESLAYFYASKVAVPVFLMISGALLLARKDSYKKTYFRVLRLAAVIIVFSYLYYASAADFDPKVMLDLKDYFIKVIRYPLTNAYWYLYAYLGILIMLPVIRRMTSGFDNRDFLYFGFWSFIFLGSYPVLTHYVPGAYYSAHIALPVFAAFIGYVIYGYYIDRFAPLTLKLCVISIAVFIVSTGISVYLTWLEYVRNHSSGGGYLFFDSTTMIFPIVSSLGIFYAVKYLCSRITSPTARRVLCYVGRTTFGIYLLGDFFIKKLEWIFYSLQTKMYPLIAMFILECAVFAAGLVVTAVLLKLPVFKKLV